MAHGPDLVGALAAMRVAQRAGPAPDAALRRDRIDRCIALLREGQDDLCAALDADYGTRPPVVTRLVEIGGAITALKHARRHLGGWMRPRGVALEWSLRLTGARAWIDYLPKGVVGVVSPWNFPIQLTFSPLAGALAAGNRAMVKLPEATPRTSALIAHLIASRFAADELSAVTGGPETGQAFAALPFDHLLFTGNPVVGRQVMAAAARNLTPVTLELGGRSPVILLPDAPLDQAARSVVSGKLLNAGQICLAPDHVLVPRALHDRFVEALEAAAREMLAAAHSDLGAIISERHAVRLRALVADARAKGARIVELGEPMGSTRIPPTLILDAAPGMTVLEAEIFGPLVPIVSYDDLDTVLADIAAGPRPLALYIFGRGGGARQRILDRAVSGGVTLGDIILHASSEAMPLGGIGESGMGAYRGRWGFDTFSHARPVFRRGWGDAGRLLRPPYGRLAAFAARHLVGPA